MRGTQRMRMTICLCWRFNYIKKDVSYVEQTTKNQTSHSESICNFHGDFFIDEPVLCLRPNRFSQNLPIQRTIVPTHVYFHAVKLCAFDAIKLTNFNLFSALCLLVILLNFFSVRRSAKNHQVNRGKTTKTFLMFTVCCEERSFLFAPTRLDNLRIAQGKSCLLVLSEIDTNAMTACHGIIQLKLASNQQTFPTSAHISKPPQFYCKTKGEKLRGRPKRTIPDPVVACVFLLQPRTSNENFILPQ